MRQFCPAAHSVFWNTASRGSAYPYCVHTQQSRYGYAIGTSGTGDDVRTNAVGISSAKTDPPDHVEGVGLGETLEPQSLYDHQAPAFLPPGAPAGVVAEAGDGRVFLDWSDNPEPDVSSYRLYRGTAMQGPYTQLAAGVAGSDYLDATVVNGTAYFYSIPQANTTGSASGPSPLSRHHLPEPRRPLVRPPFAHGASRLTTGGSGSEQR